MSSLIIKQNHFIVVNKFNNFYKNNYHKNNYHKHKKRKLDVIYENIEYIDMEELPVNMTDFEISNCKKFKAFTNDTNMIYDSFLPPPDNYCSFEVKNTNEFENLDFLLWFNLDKYADTSLVISFSNNNIKYVNHKYLDIDVISETGFGCTCGDKNSGTKFRNLAATDNSSSTYKYLQHILTLIDISDNPFTKSDEYRQIINL